MLFESADKILRNMMGSLDSEYIDKQLDGVSKMIDNYKKMYTAKIKYECKWYDYKSRNALQGLVDIYADRLEHAIYMIYLICGGEMEYGDRITHGQTMLLLV